MSSLEHQFDHDGNASTRVEGGASRSSKWLDSVSVSRKLSLAILGSTISLGLVATFILAGTWSLGEAGRAQAVLASVEVRSNNAAIALVDAIEALEQAEQSPSQFERDRALQQSSAELELAHQSLTAPIDYSGGNLPSEYGPTLYEIRDSVAVLNSRSAAFEGDQSELTQLRADTQLLYNKLSDWAVDIHTPVAASGDRLMARITMFLTLFVVLTVTFIVISLLAARLIVRDVTSKVANLTDAMEQIADGDAGTEIPGRERGDEIGDMARALAVFRDASLELGELHAARARDAEEKLAQEQLVSQQARDIRREKSQLLEGLADGFEVSIGDLISAVSAASEQLKSTSNHMVKLADGSHDQAQGAREAMNDSTSNVTAAAAATDEFALSIGEISRQASASAQLARGASDLVSSANTRMSDLSQAALEIGEIVELIQTIAQRTNLLALNASIEAARGGEAGRGFAVVASEVKELATQTSNATNSVTERITAMQDSTQSSANDLSSIVDRIAELEQAAVMIAGAVDQQSVSGDELARNIETVAKGAAQIGKRLSSLGEASHEAGSAANEVVASANALGSHADDLRIKAGRFIDDVRLSARELETRETAPRASAG